MSASTLQGVSLKTPEELRSSLTEHVDRRQYRLFDLTRQLIRIPSENTPPRGYENDAQRWIAGQLRASGFKPDVYEFDDVPDLAQHSLYHPGRDYTGRPNVAAVRRGTGGGRSLILSGHVDTVPRGSERWSHDPFGGEHEGNRIFGRGANDMKAGVATNLFVLECLNELGLLLAGDLTFESVIDEEFGGCNGTLAGRLRGYRADAAIISEPSSLRICPAQRGGRTAHITFRASGGVLQNGKFPAGVIPQLTQFLAAVPDFAAQRSARAPSHEMYAGYSDPVPVSITKIVTSPWGYEEPITVPETARVEFYWQLMPGEGQAQVEREFLDWLQGMVYREPQVFPAMPEVEFPLRWLPGSSISRSEPLVQAFAACAQTVLGNTPPIAGIEGPCDLFIFQTGFQMPAILWGARGGNTHAANEYVEFDSLVEAAKALLLFCVEWCG